MRIGKIAATVAVLTLATVLGAGARQADARDPFVVKRFLLGRLEPTTHRFVATGARGTTNAYRDNVIMLVFSAPLEFGTLDGKTVGIGIPTSGGLMRPAEGTLIPYATYARDESDPSGGAYRRRRTYRNRVLFDPTMELGCPANPNHGFDSDTTYSVTIAGTDRGATRTVRSTAGTPLEASFATTFATTDEYIYDYYDRGF